MKYQGRVAHSPFATGSKSDHLTVVLLTPDGPLKLRRPGGNPFEDPELEKLVGQEILCDGDVHAGQLMMHTWNVVTE